jgi:hypothetical protein
MLAFIDPKTRALPDHPLRTIKAVSDRVLTRLSLEFDHICLAVGRPSIPVERQLKASLLIALYSVTHSRCQLSHFRSLLERRV